VGQGTVIANVQSFSVQRWYFINYHENVCSAVICYHVYYGEWLVDISFTVSIVSEI
jgi:hypothetical protein